MFDVITVAVVVGLAAFSAGRWLYRTMAARGSCCGECSRSACGGCTLCDLSEGTAGPSRRATDEERRPN